MPKLAGLEEQYLETLRRENCGVTVFLMNGFQMRGVITGFDSFTVVLTADGKQNLIYKHAISTVSPSRAVDLSDWEDTL